MEISIHSVNALQPSRSRAWLLGNSMGAMPPCIQRFGGECSHCPHASTAHGVHHISSSAEVEWCQWYYVAADKEHELVQMGHH